MSAEIDELEDRIHRKINRLIERGERGPEADARLAELRDKLWQVQAARPPPFRQRADTLAYVTMPDGSVQTVDYRVVAQMRPPDPEDAAAVVSAHNVPRARVILPLGARSRPPELKTTSWEDAQLAPAPPRPLSAAELRALEKNREIEYPRPLSAAELRALENEREIQYPQDAPPPPAAPAAAAAASGPPTTTNQKIRYAKQRRNELRAKFGGKGRGEGQAAKQLMKEARAADKTGDHELAKHLRWQSNFMEGIQWGLDKADEEDEDFAIQDFDARLEDIRQKWLKCAEGSHSYEFYKELYNALTASYNWLAEEWGMP